MTPRPPALQPRDEAAVLADLLERSPGYLPAAWRPRPGGGGQALLRALAHFTGLVGKGLAQVPERQLLAFLDAMGIALLPPRAARAPLVFQLAEGAPADVALPAGTEVTAAVEPALPSSLTGHRSPRPAAAAAGPVPFATDLGITLARAGLASVHSIVPAADAIADHTAALPGAFAWFDQDAQELVPHHLYLGHGSLFDLPDAAEVSLHVSQTQLPAGPGRAPPGRAARVRLRWEYLTAEGWLGFEPVIDQTQSLTVDGEVVLRKVCGAPTVRAELHGIESFWIRARVDQALPPPGAGAREGILPRLDTIRARVALTEAAIPMDAGLVDGVPVDTTREFLPFGAEPVVGSTFLLACDDAFRRAGAEITLSFTLSAASDAAGSGDLQLTGEHSTGDGTWAQTFSRSGNAHDAAGFLDGKGSGSGANPHRGIAFSRPDDWRPATVEGREHHWLRIRITAGGYGGPTQYQTERTPPSANNPESWRVVATNRPRPPLLAGVTAAYTYRTAPAAPEHCLSRNRFSFADHTEACRWGRQPFRPFEPVADREPAAYLGFDQPLPVGLVSLYVDIAGGTAVGASGTPFVWEYRSRAGWSELSSRDETDGFRQPGMLQLVGPADHLPDDGPGRQLWWLRARSKTASAQPEPLPVAGLHHNAVWATERRSVRGEVLGQSDGTPGIAVTAKHPPVLPGERVEVREWHGAGREWASLFAGVEAAALRYDRDAAGLVVAVWVTWQQRPHLHSSGPRDRHYTLEPGSGLVRFGDGESGRVPPPGALLAMSYDYGGGIGGNVGAGRISQLNSAVPYVEAVTNPVPAGGGADAETVDVARVRGPQHLRNRGRALAAADYEWIAREATAEVAVARCLPATGPVGGGQAGWVTVVVAPWSALPRPQPSRELLARVRAHLASRAPAAVGASVRVVGPAYTPVSVLAEVEVSSPTRAAEIEQELHGAIDVFLHPLTGGPRQRGWRFGQAVHLSQVARLIEQFPGVDHATFVQLAVAGAVHGDHVPIPPDRLPAAGRHLLKLRLGSAP